MLRYGDDSGQEHSNQDTSETFIRTPAYILFSFTLKQSYILQYLKLQQSTLLWFSTTSTGGSLRWEKFSIFLQDLPPSTASVGVSMCGNNLLIYNLLYKLDVCYLFQLKTYLDIRLWSCGALRYDDWTIAYSQTAGDVYRETHSADFPQAQIVGLHRTLLYTEKVSFRIQQQHFVKFVLAIDIWRLNLWQKSNLLCKYIINYVWLHTDVFLKPGWPTGCLIGFGIYSNLPFDFPSWFVFNAPQLCFYLVWETGLRNGGLTSSLPARIGRQWGASAKSTYFLRMTHFLPRFCW